MKYLLAICRSKEPRATIDAVRMGRKKMFVTSAKAEQELGWMMSGLWRAAAGSRMVLRMVTPHRYREPVRPASMENCEIAIVAALHREVSGLYQRLAVG